MRIISGKRKSKRIFAPNNLQVRPTTDFAKEALFNIINNYFDFQNIKVLDLFAGTGNISYEFASREAIQILSVDSNQNCVNFINKTAEMLEFKQMSAIKVDALSFIEKNTSKWDIIFADPPFDFEKTSLIPQIIFENNLLNNNDSWFILEHPNRINFENHPNLFDYRNYGAVCFSFFKLNNTEDKSQ